MTAINNPKTPIDKINAVYVAIDIKVPKLEIGSFWRLV
jgi:hypothetical protein